MNMKRTTAMSMLVICILFVSVLGSLLLNYTVIGEPFMQRLSLLVDEKPDKLLVYAEPHVTTPTVLSLSSVSKNIILSSVEQTAMCRVTDAFTAIYYNRLEDISKYVFVGAFQEDKVSLVIISPISNPKVWFQDKYVIGYSKDTQKDILQIMLNSLKPNHNITLKKVEDTQTIRNRMNDTYFQEHNIDALCFYQAIGEIKLNNNFKMQVIDYADELDTSKLSVLLPYAQKNVFDFAMLFPQLKGKRAVLKSVLSFDVIIVAKTKKIDNLNVQEDLNKIIQYINTPTKSNFYAMFMRIYPLSIGVAKEHDTYVRNRDTLQILEQFVQQATLPIISCKSSVDGFFDVSTKRFTIKGKIIEGIDISLGMIIVMNHQTRPYENGTYIVVSVGDEYSHLLQDNVNTSKDLGLTQNPPVTNNSYSYVCYGNQSIQSKGLCESPFDEQGQPKRKQTVWDRPCIRDTECPFFQANRNYHNYRGGCIDGRCEMPIGIQPISYQKYDPQYKPVCHGCKTSNDAYCCDDQKERKMYPQLITPDYAFELDFFERLAK